jgi:poly(3-hydroxybutyrate) depolymerase
MQNVFTGVIAYPNGNGDGGPGWPTNPSDSNWAANLANLNALMSMPEVDRSRVFALGYSGGGEAHAATHGTHAVAPLLPD